MAGELDDRELMSRYRDGDIKAFDALYARHKGPLYRYFLRQGVNADTAAELFQEVWVRVIRAKQRYRPTAGFQTYMYRIAHNCLIDDYRKSGRNIVVIDAAAVDVQELPGVAADEPEVGVSEAEVREKFHAALEALPDEQREAFVLREEGGMSTAQIAEVTGVSSETVKSRLRYAVNKLRKIMATEESLI